MKTNGILRLWKILKEQRKTYGKNLLYFDKRQVSAEDAQIIKDLSAEYLADLETRFALTPEELEELEKKVVSNSGEIYSSECREFLKNR